MSERENPVDILIVDDNPLIVRLLAEMLEDEGYRVGALAGADVVELALSAPPRLIVLDVLMPGLDGPEVCRRLRADPRTATVPIVFVSALPPATLALRLQDCPYDALITKPFNIDQVAEMVRQLLESRPA
jgi:CheY-like chemotaxis protein